jgi:hypothetical protein
VRLDFRFRRPKRAPRAIYPTQCAITAITPPTLCHILTLWSVLGFVHPRPKPRPCASVSILQPKTCPPHDLPNATRHHHKYLSNLTSHTPFIIPIFNFNAPGDTKCVRSVSASRGQKRAPWSFFLTMHPRTSTLVSTSPYILYLHPPPCNFISQAIPSMYARYLPFGAKNPCPRLFSLTRHPATLTCISNLSYKLPVHAPPCNYVGQAIPSMYARYLSLGATNPRPRPISASRPPTTSTCISTPSHGLPLHSPPCI